MRTLTFSDGEGTERTWHPDGTRSAFDAFADFMEAHLDDDSTSVRVEDAETGDALVFLFEEEAVARVRGAGDGRSAYRVVDGGGAYRTLVVNFARGGFASLDRFGPWLPDLADLARARLRNAFETSPLRRTHPRELRRRLELLTRAGGRAPTTDGEVTRFGFGDGAGGTVDAWWTTGGRALLVTYDPDGALGSPDGAHAALYDGVPEDLLALARNTPAAETAGGALPAATGVFHLSGPCAMATGLVDRLRETGAEIGDTGTGRLLDPFLTGAGLTPETVARAAPGWRAEDVAAAFAETAAVPAPAPADRETLDRFCRIWADSGYNDRWDVHYVFFDGHALERTGGSRDELLRLIGTLGLERVDAPPGAATGEVWVRTDPRIDAELGRWA
ncbi:DUF6357 family protein [Streptomyces termitum]|uniref:Uncharacterized protein n=1 Tax=Streptomyces termitum TaxID=67368 RepID=A0A918TCI4_9ACTN|nr:hypothetical protein GCM10010305_58520 [Streptomyces termitum]